MVRLVKNFCWLINPAAMQVAGLFKENFSGSLEANQWGQPLPGLPGHLAFGLSYKKNLKIMDNSGQGGRIFKVCHGPPPQ